MAEVKFSVVIPTRDRAATLAYTLRTCLNQSHDDYEVLVSDNDGSRATRDVVDQAASPLLRYMRTPSLVSMAANWEFAVAHARGEYVILIGDDDALLPHALAELELLTRDARPQVIRWEPVLYTWPSYPLAGQGNYLRVPLLRGIREADGMTTVRAVAAYQSPPDSLPSIYHGAVRRDVLDSIRKSSGRVFAHRFPAIYSGFAIAAAAGRFLSVDSPMSICGRSESSFTVPRPFSQARLPSAREFQLLNEREGFLPDSRVPDLAVFPHAVVADAFMAAKRMHFHDSDIEISRRQLAAGCVSNMRVESESDWRAGLRLIRDSLSDDAALQAWFKNGLGKTPYRKAAPARVRPARLGFDETSLHLDASKFAVSDVAAAAEICERILNFRPGIRHDSRTRSLAIEVADLRLTSSRQQAVIDSLQHTCEERLIALRRLERQRGLFFRLGTFVKKMLGTRLSG